MGADRRNNRVRLRAWREKNDPEYQARIQRAIAERRGFDPVTGRPKRYSRYANRELLVMTGGDQENPLLEWFKYDDIAARNKRSHWLSGPMARRFGLNETLPQT